MTHLKGLSNGTSTNLLSALCAHDLTQKLLKINGSCFWSAKRAEQGHQYQRRSGSDFAGLRQIAEKR
jgi:hypothetical protein